MKKRVFGAFLLMMLVMLPMSAQLRFGVSGGMLMNKISVRGYTLDTKNSLGWYVGPTVEVGVPLTGLKFDASAHFQRIKAECDAGDFTINTLSLPLNLKYVIGLGGLAGIYLAAGPQFDYVLNSKYRAYSIPAYTTREGVFSKAQVSINVGAGVRLLRHLQLGASYNIPTKWSNNLGFFEVRNNIWKVNMTVLF